MTERLTFDFVKATLNCLNNYSSGWELIKNSNNDKLEYIVFQKSEERFKGTLKEVMSFINGVFLGYSQCAAKNDKKVPLNIEKVLNKEYLVNKYKEYPYEFTFKVQKIALNEIYSFTSEYHISIYNIERYEKYVFFTLRVAISKLGNLQGNPNRTLYIRVSEKELDITDMNKTVSKVLYWIDRSLRDSAVSNEEDATFIARFTTNQKPKDGYVNDNCKLDVYYSVGNAGICTKSFKIKDINVLEQKNYSI